MNMLSRYLVRHMMAKASGVASRRIGVTGRRRSSDDRQSGDVTKSPEKKTPQGLACGATIILTNPPVPHPS